MARDIKIFLEDKGQDLTWFRLNEKGIIQESSPGSLLSFRGGYIPIKVQKIGKPCAIHFPPLIIFGFLKYKVTKIEYSKNRDDYKFN